MIIKIVTSMCALLSVILLTAAAHAATITVNTLVDENNTNAAACSLREAITNANNDSATSGLGCVAGAGTDDIVFSVTGTITLTATPPTITTSMNIDGGNSSLLTISGNNNRRPFFINGSIAVTLANMTITNAFNTSQGGGILNSGGAVTTLSGITITNSRSPQGGGLQNDATMTINNSTISNNQATNGGGGGISNFGTLTITNSTISNNTATVGGGGVSSSSGSLTVSDSTFSGNSTAVNGIGGAITNIGGTLLSVVRSTFIGNSANGEGGAIYITTTTTPAITNSTFFNNTSVMGSSAISSDLATTLTNCTITGNRGGSAVVINNAATAFVNNIITGNTNADGTIQRDIGFNNSGTVDGANSFNNIVGTDSTSVLTNGVNGNQVGITLANVRLSPLGSYGGAVQTIPIRTNSPARNAGRNTGAPATDARGFNRPQAVTVDIGAFEIQVTSIVTNANNGGAGSLRQAVLNAAAGEIIQFETPFFDTARTISLSTGQINLNKNLTINGGGANLLTIRNTQAANTTSRVFIIPGVFTVNLSGMTISGGNLNGDLDELTGSGGGIYSDGGNLTLNAVHITANNGSYRGGGIAAYNGSTTILNSSITNNTMNTTQLGSSGAGGIYTDQQTVVITNSTISGNSAAGESFLSGGILNVGNLNNTIITNCTITNNSALTNGSAGGLVSGNGTTLVRNSIIAANANNSSISDVRGAITSGGFNIVGNRGSVTGFNQPTDQFRTDGIALDPGLYNLNFLGNPTPTHALRPNSPALDKGSAFGSPLDQNGLPRTFDINVIANVGDGTDIGASEAQTNPTAAAVTLTGRVLTPDGYGLKNARVVLITTEGDRRAVSTTAFGHFQISEVAAGATYVLQVQSKRYSFSPQIISVGGDITDLIFVGQNPPEKQ